MLRLIKYCCKTNVLALRIMGVMTYTVRISLVLNCIGTDHNFKRVILIHKRNSISIRF